MLGVSLKSRFWEVENAAPEQGRKWHFCPRTGLGKVKNDISAPEPEDNSMEALGNRHNCTRTGLERLKMTSLRQNRHFSIADLRNAIEHS